MTTDKDKPMAAKNAPVIVFNREDFPDTARPNQPFPGYVQVEIEDFDSLANTIIRDKLGLPHDQPSYVLVMKRRTQQLDIQAIIPCKFPDGRTCNVYARGLTVVTEARAKEMRANYKEKSKPAKASK